MYLIKEGTPTQNANTASTHPFQLPILPMNTASFFQKMNLIESQPINYLAQNTRKFLGHLGQP